MEFKDKLKEKRDELKLSQEELATKLNISRQSISKWERGQSYPSIETLLKLSDIFQITLDELLKGDDYLTEEIVKKGKQLKYPVFNNVIDAIGLLGIIVLIGKVGVLLVNRIPTINIPLLSSNVYYIIALLFLLLSWLGHETIGKTYKD